MFHRRNLSYIDAAVLEKRISTPSTFSNSTVVTATDYHKIDVKNGEVYEVTIWSINGDEVSDPVSKKIEISGCLEETEKSDGK